ncbi:hypothetical protein K9U39_14150 [Rhodoblastus acidophilus]|uniref:Uncharacterized protein n=1 Tax=Candidatus Rhodoblastus alkanivorans TaxID=2954117 RepID=A0ABS9ZAM0_9HYPH|nr:hypothetical protein [Candidatus Rhodoblastus alkanivorans]MCI4677754.1 hypothetical protein [Candidatus Rhodoblastus alkanivorans]MCI4684748.1 hypothetical protein [Candidatus Rhodoblastus alkanivorans]MDI4642071.1 hypothetical protein [Rhodoblastus acidophilus]
MASKQDVAMIWTRDRGVVNMGGGDALAGLTPDDCAALALVRYPDEIRGYGHARQAAIATV